MTSSFLLTNPGKVRISGNGGGLLISIGFDFTEPRTRKSQKLKLSCNYHCVMYKEWVTGVCVELPKIRMHIL